MNWWDDVEAEALKRGAAAAAQDADPVYQARMAAKKKEEHERGVRLGWWDENGEPLPPLEGDEDDEEIDDSEEDE